MRRHVHGYDRPQERTYRHRVFRTDLFAYEIRVKETDLLIQSDKRLEKEAQEAVYRLREQIESYIDRNPLFLYTLSPLEEDPYAPPVVRDMISAGRKAQVGPMAAVAGAVAEHVGRELLTECKEVIVENGGDIFAKTEQPLRIGLFAGRSPLSSKLAIYFEAHWTPLGICSSSGTVGHSFSEGVADLACVVCKSAALADALATALGNRVRSKKEVNHALEWIQNIEEVLGAVVIVEEALGAWGNISLQTL
jgi:ApbE superfamily uncharacterized protein (UPF0280 family)